MRLQVISAYTLSPTSPSSHWMNRPVISFAVVIADYVSMPHTVTSDSSQIPARSLMLLLDRKWIGGEV